MIDRATEDEAADPPPVVNENFSAAAEHGSAQQLIKWGFYRAGGATGHTKYVPTSGGLWSGSAPSKAPGLGCHTGATLGLVLRGALVLFGAVTRSLSFLPGLAL